jgi:hypothetical protein
VIGGILTEDALFGSEFGAFQLEFHGLSCLDSSRHDSEHANRYSYAKRRQNTHLQVSIDGGTSKAFSFWILQMNSKRLE